MEFGRVHIWSLLPFHLSSPSQITTLVFNQLLNHSFKYNFQLTLLHHFQNTSPKANPDKSLTVKMQFKVVALFAAMASVAAAGE